MTLCKFKNRISIKSITKCLNFMENSSCSKSEHTFSCKKDIKHKLNLVNKSECNIPKKIMKIEGPNEGKFDLNKIKRVISEKYHVTFETVPTKSESDKKEYLVMKLSNGLTALLISDVENLIDPSEIVCEKKDAIVSEIESSDSDSDDSKSESNSIIDGFEESRSAEKKEKLAACALSINVGSFSDPETVPGLAHFLEHMLFMGSEKFPKENDFDSYISTRGGSTNASTECEYTTFYFDCPDKYLCSAMDRFANFFVSPLMKRDSMSREREAVESEFKLSFSSDSVRLEQLFCSTAPLNNPAHKFMWGNLKTLKENVTDDMLYETLREFWKTEYSANLMCVAVQARLPLDILGIWVAQYFGKIHCNNKSRNTFPCTYPPFQMDLFHKIYTVMPVKDINRLQLTWALPSVLHLYKSKPLSYLSFLIGHEGEGSLLSYLQAKLWALQISAGCDDSGIENNSIYSLFCIDIDLTDEGLNNIEQIIKLVFSYIKLLQKTGPSESVFKECQTLCKMKFCFQQESEASDYVESLSVNMHFYPPEDYLSGDELLFEYKPNEITRFLDLMTPENVNVMILSKTASKKVVLDQIEPWFNTKYRLENVPEESVCKWQECEIDSKFFIPKPNIYIPSDFNILPAPDRPHEYPINVMKDKYLEVWYKPDTKFKLPYGYVKIYFISPIASMSPQNSVMCNIFVSLFKMLIIKETYPASLAELSFSFSPEDNGLVLTINGFNHKIPLLLKKVLTEMTLFVRSKTIPKGLFEAVKEEQRKEYRNRILKASKLANELRLSILCTNIWSCVSKLEAISGITIEKLQEFNSNFFEHLYIKSLIQGNISEKQAIDMLCEVKEIVSYKPLLTGTYPEIRTRLLPSEKNIIRVQSFSTQDTNCNVTNYYQCGLNSINDCCMVEILMLIMEEPLFDTLRTQEQLAYEVSCGIKDTYGVLGFTVTVKSQADKFNVDYIENRITSFLKKTKTDLENMDLEDFNQIKESLNILKMQDDTHLKDDVQRNWAEIVNDDYMFDRIEREIKAIKSIKLADLNQYFKIILDDNIIIDKNDNITLCLRKLSIQVDAEGHPKAEPTVNKETNNVEMNEINYTNQNNNGILQIKFTDDDKLSHKFIKDIENFKRRLFIFPSRNGHINPLK